MWGVMSRNRQSGGIVPAALALLLLFRLLIPSGYMIAPNAEGRPGLALCAAPAQAAVEAAMKGGHDSHPADPARSEAGQLPCAFASPAAPPLPPDLPAVTPQVPVAAVPPAIAGAAVAVRVVFAAPPPPSTGPPLSV